MMQTSFDALRITGVKINYFFICRRKLWLFDRGIQMEQGSERVMLGRLLDKYSYPRKKRRRITIDDLIAIDLVEKDAIREVKCSRVFEKASIMQIGYYLFYLKQMGIDKKGVISYPRLRKSREVVLTDELISELKEAIRGIEEVLKMPSPPAAERKPYCRKCAYFEFCFA